MSEYLNGKKFREIHAEAMKQDKCTDELAACFMLIANRLGSKYNFVGYTWLDDMKADALLACVIGWRHYDVEKSENIFSYFTTAVYNAFLQTIRKNNRHSQLKDDIQIELSRRPTHGTDNNSNAVGTFNIWDDE